MPPVILVVDDEPLKRITLQIELNESGYTVFEAADALAAKHIFESQPIDVVVSDVRMPGMNGLELLTYVKQTRPDVDVILMTAYSTVETAVLAIKRGAYDYITKPFTTPELIAKLDQLLAIRAARSEALANTDPLTAARFVAKNARMTRLLEHLTNARTGQRPVFLVGESGVGKRALVNAIWLDDLYIIAQVDCEFGDPVAVEAALIASPMLMSKGHVVHALNAHALTLALQAKLLAVIASQQVAARYVFSSSADLDALVREGKLRTDFSDLLRPLSFVIPPLRERIDEIPPLVEHFLVRHRDLAGDRSMRCAVAALDELMRHSWPGNVAELEHVIERSLVLCTSGEIRPEHILPLGVALPSAPIDTLPLPENSDGVTFALTETVAEIERRMILSALRQCAGNQARAALKLGIPRTTLRDKMAKYNIAAE